MPREQLPADTRAGIGAPSGELSEKENAVIDIMSHLIPAARKEAYKECGIGNSVLDGLVARGLVSKSKTGAYTLTLDGKNARIPGSYEVARSKVRAEEMVDRYKPGSKCWFEPSPGVLDASTGSNPEVGEEGVVTSVKLKENPNSTYSRYGVVFSVRWHNFGQQDGIPFNMLSFYRWNR
jgi:hypothetical protein